MIYKHHSMTMLLIIIDKQRIITYLLLIIVQKQIQLIGTMPILKLFLNSSNILLEQVLQQDLIMEIKMVQQQEA